LIATIEMANEETATKISNTLISPSECDMRDSSLAGYMEI